MKIIVAGTRTFSNYKFLERVLDYYISHKLLNIEDIEIVSGGARGADKLGEQYARKHGYSLKVFPAKWNLYGKQAGYLRNSEMADYGDCLIAFWNGESRGTMHMINLAKQKGLKVYVIDI